LISHRALAEIIGSLLVVSVLALAAYELVSEHNANVEAQSKVEAAQQLAQQFQQANLQLKEVNGQLQQESEATREALAKATDALSAQRAAAVTPAEVASLVSKESGVAPQIIQLPAQNGQPPERAATLSLPDLSKLGDFTTQCVKCQLTVSSQQQQIANLNQQNKNLEQTNANTIKEMQAIETQRDAYKAELKGGTFFQRLARDMKQGAGATAGGAVGAVSCSKARPAIMAGCAGVGALTGFVLAHL
jgi:hypothetical protein